MIDRRGAAARTVLEGRLQLSRGPPSQSSLPTDPGSAGSCDMSCGGTSSRLPIVDRVPHKYSQKMRLGSKELSAYLNMFTL